LALQLYKGEFEEKLLFKTEAFYQAISDHPIENLSNYLTQVENYLKNEQERVFECLDICTLKTIIALV
jgi:hypothetical protein